MKLKLTAAAQKAGVDKSTLRRAIDSGRLSAERTDAGAFLVDASELARWMGARAAEAGQSAAPWADDAKAERDAWRAQAERLAITHQPPPAQPQEGQGARPSLWRRLFGG